MKTVVSSALLVVFGIYMLVIGFSDWESHRSITVFVKGARDMVLSGDKVWLGLIINGSLSLALILGGVGQALLTFTKEAAYPVVILGIAGLLFLMFIVSYAFTLMLVY